MRLPPLLDRLDGPPPSLPRVVDRCSEHYWGLGPRHRVALGMVVALLLLLVVTALLGRSPWGEPVEVTVAGRDLAPGETVSEDDVSRTRWPAGLVPEGAVRGSVEGTLVGVLPAGAVLTEAHLGEGGRGALVAEGRVALAVPHDLLAEHTVGALVDLVGPDGGGGARTLATGARVLAVDDLHVWLEVDPAEAPDAAAATQQGTLATVVRRP